MWKLFYLPKWNLKTNSYVVPEVHKIGIFMGNSSLQLSMMDTFRVVLHVVQELIFLRMYCMYIVQSVYICVLLFAYICRVGYHMHPQSRQSAKLFLKSSELGPNPSPAGECSPSPQNRGGGGGHTRWRERGWESPNFDEEIHCGTLYIYVLCVCTSVYCTMYSRRTVDSRQCTLGTSDFKKIGFLGKTFFGCTFYKGHMYIFEISMKKRIFWYPTRPNQRKKVFTS